MFQWLKRLFAPKPIPAPRTATPKLVPPKPLTVTKPAAPTPQVLKDTTEGIAPIRVTSYEPARRVQTEEGAILASRYAPKPYKAPRQYVSPAPAPRSSYYSPPAVQHVTETVHHHDSGPDLLTTMLVINALSSHNESPSPAPYECPAPAPSYSCPAPSPSYDYGSSSSDSYSSSSSDSYSSSSDSSSSSSSDW